MTNAVVKHTDIKKLFIDHLGYGTGEIIQQNRENLEARLREEINIDNAYVIIKSRDMSNETTRIAPEFFMALSLVDEIPEKIDFRINPVFKMEGVLFNSSHSTSNVIEANLVPYNKSIAELLKIQLHPDVEAEAKMSKVYLDRIKHKMGIFDSIVRGQMSLFFDSVFRKIRDAALREKTMRSFYLAASCVNNSGKNFGKRKVRHYLHMSLGIRGMCCEFIRVYDALGNKKDTLSVYESLIIVVINKMFPKLPKKAVERIVGIALDWDNHFVYENVWDIVSWRYSLSRKMCSTIEKCRTIGKDAFEKKGKEKSLRQPSIDAKLFNKEFNVEDRETSINNHSFLNLILFIDKVRREENIVKDKELKIALKELKGEINDNGLATIKKRRIEIQTHRGRVRNIYNFSRAVNELIEFEKWRDQQAGTPLANLHTSFIQALESQDRLFRIAKDEDVDISWSRLNGRILESWIQFLYPTIRKFGRKNNERSQEWLDLIKDNSVAREFCETPSAWGVPENGNSLFEVISKDDMSNINNISGVGFMNFLFKEQLGSDYFDSVDHILFHKAIIIVRRNNELFSIPPCEMYSQFILTHADDEKQVETREDDIILELVVEIFNKIFNEKTKERFGRQSGGLFIDSLSKSTGIKFTNTIEKGDTKGITQQHDLSFGSLSDIEQDNFRLLITNYPFIFPEKISEMHLSLVDGRKRQQLPTDKKEFLFFIENLRDDKNRKPEYYITLEDLMLLGIDMGLYSVILLERAFSVIYNKEILENEQAYSDLKEATGRESIMVIERHYKLRAKPITESRILRKIFIQNCMWFIQDKKDQLSEQMLEIINTMFRFNKKITG